MHAASHNCERSKVYSKHQKRPSPENVDQGPYWYLQWQERWHFMSRSNLSALLGGTLHMRAHNMPLLYFAMMPKAIK